MDWRDIVVFVGVFILLIDIFFNDEFKKMHEKLKKKIKELQNENKN